MSRSPLPPFDAARAAPKVRLAEDAGNRRERVVGVCTADRRRRDRAGLSERGR